MEPDAVTPRDCAAVVAIPRSLEDLEHDLQRPDREFTRGYILPAFGAATARAAWEGGYQAFVGRVAEILAEARQLGVTVVEDAGLPDLAGAFRGFRAVTLVAHSPFRLLTPADITDAAAVTRAIRASRPGAGGHPVVERLARDDDVREAESAAELVRALNPIFHATREWFRTATAGGGAPADLTALHLYEAFPGAVRPPAVLELRDGVHDFEALCRAVPCDFRGTTDYLACSGLWFAEALRRRRPRCGDFLCPQREAHLTARAELYRVVVRLLDRHPMSYADAVRLVHAAARGEGNG